MTDQPVCPNQGQLRRLLDETLGEAEQAALTRHLDDCTSCQRNLERLAAIDPSIESTARRLSPDGFGDGMIVRDLVARFRDREKKDLATADVEPSLDFLIPSDRADLLGTLAHYEVVKVIGQGGMGVVLKAFDPPLNRFVAIKVLAPQLAAVAAARRRFAREARAAAAVSHDHVVPIYAVDEFKGHPYLVMPLITGESLQDRLDRRGPLDVPQILRIAMQAASGLAAAHAQGLIHRDIKPSNILLENGVERVKITDFGLARTVDDASLTQSGMLAGTPQYMSPEQAHGEPLDARADLFSLGGVMYAMCLGRPPFRASSALAVLKAFARIHPDRSGR